MQHAKSRVNRPSTQYVNGGLSMTKILDVSQYIIVSFLKKKKAAPFIIKKSSLCSSPVTLARLR